MNLSLREGTVDVVDAYDDTALGHESGVNAKTHAAPPHLPGRYKDLGEIASGSFGEVRRVQDTLLDRIVAMKLLHAEHADSIHLRERFLAEVHVTAQLQHPGIVAVHDRGELSDGRLWFTMKEIRGRTLREVIDELHAASGPGGFGTTSSGWTFRRLVDAFARIVQAIAYAHSRGVVHRDIKPENLMVGEFGEVLVMDWGLARRVGFARNEFGGTEHFHDEQSPGLTQHGDILGTPAYMPPEQARGALSLHGPASDVYALGAVLYCLLAGKPPYQGSSSRDILTAVLTGPPKPLAEVVSIPLPVELCKVCERAMRRDINERYPNASVMSDELVAWLDGARRREQALEALQQARSYEPEISRLRSEEKESHDRARSLQNDLRPYDPIEKKRPAWELEDEANQSRRAAALTETKWLEAVHGALSVDPQLPEAHDLLADHYRQRLNEAELEHRDDDAARAEELLRIHDRGKHASFLRGDGRLTLVTDLLGAEVFVDRYVLQDRRLVAVPEGCLGKTPLVEVPLQRGSYLLRILAPGRAEVRYPVLIERDGHWDGIAPGEREPFPIYLPNQNELGPDDVYVPAGWTWLGGDPGAVECWLTTRIWVDAFILRRFPVTNTEYLEFLNDLIKTGREAEALAACPRPQASMPQQSGQNLFARDAAGLFCLTSVTGDCAELQWQPSWPVVLIDWYGARAYAKWVTERSHCPWRLPNEVEREKASRGADGRSYPWGDHFDANWACVLDSYAKDPTRVGVEHYPLDESPYGIRGLAGNVRDWCENAWTADGLEIHDARALSFHVPKSDTDLCAVRGGSWTSPSELSRADARFASRPAARWRTTGLRLARRLNY